MRRAEWQILATESWSQWMTASVAVCLTLTNPYFFKIGKSFLIWLSDLFVSSKAEWNHPHPAVPSSSSSSSIADSRTSLRQSRQVDYGTSKKPDNHAGSNPPDSQHVNGKPIGAGESPSDRQLDAATSVSGEQSPPIAATVPDTQVQRNSGGQTGESQSDNQHAAAISVSGEQSPSTAATVPDTQSQRDSGGRIDDAGQGPTDTLRNSTDSRDFAWKTMKFLLHGGRNQVESPSTIAIVIITVLFGLFVAQSVAGVFSAKIASDKAGLSSSQHCGIWQFNEDAGGEAADRDDWYNYQKEARASQYARTCYNSLDLTEPFSCRIFYNQSISYTTETHQSCPFASSELCHDGLYSAVSFDTGYVDASVIGINSPNTHKFRRTTSCSPLNMSEPYVLQSSLDTNSTAYHYYYGSKDNTNYTFNTAGQPFDWLVPVYSVNTYFSSLYPESDYWQPIPKLKPPVSSTLTIIFVSSLHIYHVKPSFDPIFPATEPHYFDGYREPYYYNADPRARALGCVDTTELCSPDGRTCWSMTSPLPPGVQSSSEYWLMKWALENSNIYDSIKWRLGTALLAQESISQSVSIPLDPNQWQLEASQLFATSLARVQYDAWKIATGEDRDRPGYVEVTPDEAKGDLCGLYKFKTSDYTNVNFLGLIGLPLLALTVFFLSWDAHVVGLGSKKDGSTTSEPLIIDVIVRFICHLLLLLPVGIYTGATALFRTIGRYIKSTIGRYVNGQRPDSNMS